MDDILNVLDGINEADNRIVVITSNFYNKLDSALIRPGRIDITLDLGYIYKEDICDFYKYVFNESLLVLNMNKEITPAEMMNLYLMSCNNKKTFVSLLES